VPSSADAQQLKVDPAETLDQPLVVAALGLQVAGHAVGQMGVPRVDVHMPKEMMLHVMTIGVGVRRKQADILIEVERAAEGEIQVLILVQPDEVTVDQLHGFSGGKSEDEVRVGPQFSRHHPGDQTRGGFLVGLNDDFDAADSSRFAQRRQEKGH
jgi:hypothetical protein